MQRKQDNDSKTNLLCTRVNIRRETVIFRKVYLKGRPLAGIWELGLQEGSHHSLKGPWLTVPKLFVQEMQFTLNNFFPSGNLGFRHLLGRGYLSKQQPKLSWAPNRFSLFLLYFIVLRTFNVRSTLQTNCSVHRTVELTVGTVLYNTSLELIHLAPLKLYTH